MIIYLQSDEERTMCSTTNYPLFRITTNKRKRHSAIQLCHESVFALASVALGCDMMKVLDVHEYHKTLGLILGFRGGVMEFLDSTNYAFGRGPTKSFALECKSQMTKIESIVRSDGTRFLSKDSYEKYREYWSSKERLPKCGTATSLLAMQHVARNMFRILFVEQCYYLTDNVYTRPLVRRPGEAQNQ